MKLRVRNGLLLLMTAALLVVSAGCPNSQSITSGVGTAQLSITLTNPSRFDFGFFNIDRILIRPVDPDAAQIIGANRDVTLLPFGVFVDTAVQMVDPIFLDPTALSQGVYEVVELQISSIYFQENDFPTDPSTCESYQFFYSPPNIITATNFAVPLQFTVSDAQETTFALTFDLTQMVTTLNNAYTCSPGCGGFCISNFDAVQFAADTLDYLTFN